MILDRVRSLRLGSAPARCGPALLGPARPNPVALSPAQLGGCSCSVTVFVFVLGGPARPGPASTGSAQRFKYLGSDGSRLRWVGHVQRTSYDRMPKQIFYSEISSGIRSRGGQRKRYKDTLKQTLKLTGNNTETWHELAENRTAWRQAVKKGIRSFEAERLKTRTNKRQKRKAKEAPDVKIQQTPASVDFECQICDRACK